MEIETIKYSDGIYKGEVQNEQPHGKGKLTIYEGKIPISKYIGEFKKGERDGKGISYTFNIDLSESKTPSIKFVEQISYKGEFKGGRWHGVGTFVDYGEDLYYLGKSFDKTRVKGDQIIATVSGNWNNGLHQGEGKIVVYYSKPSEKQKIMKTYEGIFKEGKLVKPELTEKEKIDETLEVRIFDDLQETGSMLSKQERENFEKNLDILGVPNEWKSELDNIKKELSSYDKEEFKEKMTSGEIIEELPKKSILRNLIDKITKKN
tara:strand:+ start:93 stop:881 length:789 start_codon:yes stop_codon:yes gene_type:complete